MKSSASPSSFSPDQASFSATYDAGQPQVVWTRLVADLETPVSALLKLGPGRANSFLLESVEGGSVRGRYSIIGFDPDIIWRAHGDQPEINRSPHKDPEKFRALKPGTLKALRRLLAESRIDLPEELPPMVAGVFGYMGYDTVRLIERLPDEKSDPLGVPDSILIRPTLMVVFDAVKDEMTVVTTVYPKRSRSAHAAYAAAAQRLSQAVAALERPLLQLPGDAPKPKRTHVSSNTAKQQYQGMVQRAKEYKIGRAHV